MGNNFEKARALIANEKVKNALAFIESNLIQKENLFLDQVRLLHARYASWEKQHHQFGPDTNSNSELHRIRLAILHLITQIEVTYQGEEGIQYSSNLILQNIKEKRRGALMMKIEKVSALIDQWEEKRTLSSDPTEQSKCELELKRLNEILENYLNNIAP